MTEAPAAPLVSTRWLAERLGRDDIAILDASWHLPTANRDPRAEFAARHIPGAAFFDIDRISDPASDLPHMLPDAAAFAAAMGAMGVRDDMEIVVYDSVGLFSAARAWWMLTIFGAQRVFVLDGGLPAWLAEGRPVESGACARAATTFRARLESAAVAGFEDVRQALDAGAAQVADARPAARFTGEAPEPRPGLLSGHMPGARSLPAAALMDSGRLKPAPALVEAFASAGVDPDRPLITSCGSGVSAAIINLALATLGKPPARLYDGSWTEWAMRGGPRAVGPIG